jgi:hypothetical protein
MDGLSRSRAASVLSLFTSAGTLVCCALPALLVALGAGAALSSLVAFVPQLVWLSEYKLAVFAVAGAMLAVSAVFQWRARSEPCPADPRLADACARTRRTSAWVFGLSVSAYLVGAFFAFIAPLLFD